MRSSRTRTTVALVSGVGGFIGSHLAAELCAQGKSVIGLDDLSGGFLENIPPGVRFVQGSVNDAALLARLFEQYRFDYVFHLAAFAAERLSHFVRLFNYQTNLLGAVRLINASINCGTVKCLVFSSSTAVYGGGVARATEQTTPKPADPYGISKCSVELELAAARAMFGLNSIVFRAHNVYGPGQHIGDPHRNIVGIFMRQSLLGEPLTVLADGSQTRAFTYISDVAPAMACCVERPEAYNQVFNIGSDRPCSLLELARLVCRTMGTDCAIRFLPTRPEAPQPRCSHEKARAVFGDVLGNVALETGLAKMAEWVRRTGVRQPPRYPPSEIHAQQAAPAPRVPLDKVTLEPAFPTPPSC